MTIKLKSVKTLSFFLLIIASAAACRKVEKIEKAGNTTPKLVVNCVAEPGSSFEFSITRSLNALDNAPIKTYKSATIKLYGDGKLLETIKYSSLLGGYYSDTTIARNHIKYSIEVTGSGLQTVNADLVLPEQVKIDYANLEIKGKQADSWNNGSQIQKYEYYTGGTLQLKFKDIGSESNYYLVYLNEIWSGSSVNNYYGAYGWETSYPGVESLLDQSGFSNDYGSYMFFTDRIDNGKEINLIMTRQNGRYTIVTPNDTLIGYQIELHSMSEDYYKHFYSLKTAEFNMDDPFSQPTQVFCNVRNGYGIFGGRTIDQTVVPIPH